MSDLSATRLDGQVVIVTGGSQGVGLGIARAFLDAGATVVTCARSTFDKPPAARGDEELTRRRHISADVRDESHIQAVVDAALTEFGRLDVLVNNAGGQPPADTATVSARFIKSIIDINLTGPLGWVESEALADLLLRDPGQHERYSSDIPVGRMGTPEEIGDICVFLASPAVAYINGATIWADGGGGF